MTDHDLEQRLRAWYRSEIDDRESAPLQLRAELSSLARSAATPPRGLVPGWPFPAVLRSAPLVVAAAGVLVLVLVGIGLFIRPPDVGPQPPAPTNSQVAASPHPSVSYYPGAIAYVSQNQLGPLYIVVPGEDPVALTPDVVGNDVTCPRFSPNGRMLAFGMPGGTILVLAVDEQGHAGPTGTRLGGSDQEMPHCPTWAPDSTAVAFLDDTGLVIVPLEGAARRVDSQSFGPGDEGFGVDHPMDQAVGWSPDGSAIAVAAVSGTWLVPADGSAPQRLDDTPAFSVSWSPDATRLVVGASPASSGVARPIALVLRVSDGTTLAELPIGGAPVWSPVEDRIAYENPDRGGVVVANPDGTDPVTVCCGYNPTWSPDGRQLLVMHDTAAAAWSLVAVDPTGSGAQTVIATVQITDARSFPSAGQRSWQPVAP